MGPIQGDHRQRVLTLLLLSIDGWWWCWWRWCGCDLRSLPKLLPILLPHHFLLLTILRFSSSFFFLLHFLFFFFFFFFPSFSHLLLLSSSPSYPPPPSHGTLFDGRTPRSSVGPSVGPPNEENTVVGIHLDVGFFPLEDASTDSS